MEAAPTWYGDQLLRTPMRNSILVGMALLSVATIFSCKSNYICPSFESAYILDQPTRHQKFSLFDEDTLPKEDFEVTKNKYGVIKSIKYKKKRDELLTVKMETIFPEVEPPDTLLLAEQDLSPDEIEQLLNEGERPVNHYNVDQIYYMRHFGQFLPMPEEPSERIIDEGEEAVDEEILEAPEVKKKKKWQFWKKQPQEVDSLNIGFEEDLEVEPEEKELSKKELRQQEELEREKQEEIERAREPKIIDLEDFERDRGISTDPGEQQPGKKKRVKEPKEKKKIKLGFGKKNKNNEVELEE